MSRVFIEGHNQMLEAQSIPGETLLDVLRRAGAAVSAPCGGNGTCGKCRVTLLEPDGSRDEVLACQFPVLRDLHVLPNEHTGGDICTNAAAQFTAEGRQGYGAAVDLGTTTVALKLFDLSDGRELTTVSGWNRQAPYGADVLTRCQYCMEHTDGLNTLSTLARAQINILLEQACEISHITKESVKEIYLAGNTVMEHILFGISPASIAVSPFTPATLFDRGEHLGLDGTLLFPAPCVAGYVGGDITAGLLSCALHEQEGLSLFLDIGTNGEMALGGKDGFLCCAVASGPAFEGAGISCGMASTPGAISHVHWEKGAPQLTVIGGGKPRGICGSGLLDLLAMLLNLGIVDETGYLQPPGDLDEDFFPWLDEDEDGNGIFYLTDDHSISFTARDVRALQLAKAAVAAGISVLMEQAGIGFDDIAALYLAGGFGAHMDPDSATAIGMLPDELREKIVCVGNSSLTGASMALLDTNKRLALRDNQKSCRYLELSGNGRFNALFPEHMTFDKEESPWK